MLYTIYVSLLYIHYPKGFQKNANTTKSRNWCKSCTILFWVKQINLQKKMLTEHTGSSDFIGTTSDHVILDYSYKFWFWYTTKALKHWHMQHFIILVLRGDVCVIHIILRTFLYAFGKEKNDNLFSNRNHQ